MKTKEMVLRYAKYKLAQGIDTISSIDIEDSLPKYGKALWNETRLPSAYSREWRRIRENREYLTAGIKDVKEIKSAGASYKIWQMIV
jgi:hypothetical protein